MLRIVFIQLCFVCFWASFVQAAPLRAALLLEHDQPSAWTELLRHGFAQSTARAGIDGEVIVAPAEADQTAAFRKAAAEHDLVIVASDGLHEVLRDNAANFRRVMFGVIDAGIRAPNVMCVTFADENAAYLAGAAAALLAAENNGGEPVIGWLSGMDTPAMRSLFNGYAEGALLAVPGCRVVQAVTGSFKDAEAAAGKAKWLVGAGARVITLAAGAGNPAAASVAESGGAAVIELDAPSGRPVAGVIAKAADRAVAEIVDAAAARKFAGKQITVYDLANSGVEFMGLDKYLAQHKVSERVGRRVSELRRELAAGSIRVPSLRQRTLCDCLD